MIEEITDWPSFASFMNAVTAQRGHMPALEDFRKKYGPRIPRQQFRNWARKWWRDHPRTPPHPNDRVSQRPARYRVMPTQGIDRNWTVFDFWTSPHGSQIAHFLEKAVPDARQDAERYAAILEAQHRLELDYQAALRVVNAYVKGLPKQDVINWAAALKREGK